MNLHSSLSGNVATMTANDTLFVGTVTAANVVSNAQLSGNLALYQTLAGLSSNVATLTSNNSLNLGGVAAASYELHSSLSGDVATLTSNNSNYLGGTLAAAYIQNVFNGTLTGNLAVAGLFSTEINYQGNLVPSSGLSIAWNRSAGDGETNFYNLYGLPYKISFTFHQITGNSTVHGVNDLVYICANGSMEIANNSASFQVGAGIVNATNYSGTANNSLYLGGVLASSYLTAANLSGYQLNSTLAANVAGMTANNSTNFAGQGQAYYANISDPVFTTGLGVGTSVSSNVVINTAGVFITSNTPIIPLTVYSNNEMEVGEFVGDGINSISFDVKIIIVSAMLPGPF